MKPFDTPMDPELERFWAQQFQEWRWELKSERDRRAMVERFVYTIWKGQQGLAAFALGFDPFWEDGKYLHKRRVEGRYRFPDEVDKIADLAGGLCLSADVYFAPALRTMDSRRRGSGGPSWYSWVDIDPEGRTQEELLEIVKTCQSKLPDLFGGAFTVVSSGRGLHVYFELPALAEPVEYERINKGLAELMGGDSKHAENSLLRLPGTFSHKQRVVDGTYLPVTVEEGWDQ